MLQILSVVLWNSLVAGCLAVAVFLAQRIWRAKLHPGLWHGLWLLVLVKFVTPPIIAVPIATRAAPLAKWEIDEDSAAAHDAATSSVTRRSKFASNLRVAPSTAALSGRIAGAVVSLSVLISICLLIRGVWRMSSIGRLINHARPGPGWLQQAAHQAAGSFNIRPLPSVCVVEGCLSPFLWVNRRGPIVVMPSRLICSLDRDSVDLILRHEVAHYARRDHWTNLFAALIGAALWWNPVVWWARRELRLVQECCCDALVLASDRSLRHRYAETLLKTVEFVTASDTITPTPATAFGSCHTFTRRIQMICEAEPRKPRMAARLLVGLTGLFLIAASPTIADDKDDEKRERFERLRLELREVNERMRILDSLVEQILDQEDSERHDESSVSVVRRRGQPEKDDAAKAPERRIRKRQTVESNSQRIHGDDQRSDVRYDDTRFPGREDPQTGQPREERRDDVTDPSPERRHEEVRLPGVSGQPESRQRIRRDDSVRSVREAPQPSSKAPARASEIRQETRQKIYRYEDNDDSYRRRTGDDGESNQQRDRRRAEAARQRANRARESDTHTETRGSATSQSERKLRSTNVVRDDLASQPDPNVTTTYRKDESAAPEAQPDEGPARTSRTRVFGERRDTAETNDSDQRSYDIDYERVKKTIDELGGDSESKELQELRALVHLLRREVDRLRRESSRRPTGR